MTIAHSREPYEGERKVMVAMTEVVPPESSEIPPEVLKNKLEQLVVSD